MFSSQLGHGSVGTAISDSVISCPFFFKLFGILIGSRVLVVVREHEGKSSDFVWDEPEFFFLGGYSAPAVAVGFDLEHCANDIHERSDVQHSVARVADGLYEFVKDGARGPVDATVTRNLDEYAVLEGLAVAVGAYGFAEQVVSIVHRVFSFI